MEDERPVERGRLEREGLLERSRARAEASGWVAKSLREEGFPIHVLREALQKISVVDAEASNPQDKTNILNRIAGREASEVDLQPLATHPKYDEVDQTLKSILSGFVAEVAIRKGLLEGVRLTELRLCAKAQLEKRCAFRGALFF